MSKPIIKAAIFAVALAPLVGVAQAEDNNQNGPQVLYLPPTDAPKDIRPAANLGLREQIPLSPKEIRWGKSQINNQQYALHDAPALTPSNRTINVSLDPGSRSPLIYLMPSYVTAISIVGSDGTPWPVVTSRLGSPTQFSIESPNVTEKTTKTKDGKEVTTVQNASPSNLIMIQPSFFGATTNMIVTLKDQSTPLIIMAKSGSPDGKRVDGRVTIRLDRSSPDTPPPLMIPPPPSAANLELQPFLQQVPPKDAKVLSVDGSIDGVQVWQWHNQMIVRSHWPLVLPAWTAENVQDGVSVYAMPVSPMITVRGPDNKRIRLVVGGSS